MSVKQRSGRRQDDDGRRAMGVRCGRGVHDQRQKKREEQNPGVGTGGRGERGRNTFVL